MFSHLKAQNIGTHEFRILPSFCCFKHTEHFLLIELSLVQKVQGLLNFYSHISMHNRAEIKMMIIFWMQMESSFIFSVIATLQ